MIDAVFKIPFANCFKRWSNNIWTGDMTVNMVASVSLATTVWLRGIQKSEKSIQFDHNSFFS